MAPMNAAPSFDPRALDLSGLAAPKPTGSYVTEADDQTFEALLARSMQYPLVVEFWSPRAHAEALSDDLVSLANEAAGRYLLVRVNVDTSRAVAAALGIQAVPMVVGVVSGQLAPLFQGTTDRANAKAAIEQLIQVAVANGIVGRAQPVGPAPAQEEAPGPDPRFAAADAALEAGDFAVAVDEFDKLLAQNPSDTEAAAGRAQASLLVRLADADVDALGRRADAAPDDLEAQLALADLELAGGDVDGAFGRLVDAVRRTAGAERDRARLRLLELFEAVGTSDPAVLKARRDLMSALF